MEDLLGQIESASAAGLHYVAVWSALTIPDFCGALGQPNGVATGARYIKWWDDNMPGLYSEHMPGKRAYAFRCSMLHQGSARHARKNEDRIVLMEPHPSGNIVHCGTHLDTADQTRACIIYAPWLVRDLVDSAREWMTEHAAEPTVVANMDRFVRRHPQGLESVILGAAVIA